jgi:putative intracellular protease/amidase
MVDSIAVVLFDDAEELDFVGPWEVFTMLRHVVEEPPKVFTVSEHGGTVTCAKGMRVVADYSFRDCPEPGLVLIPGGMGTRREAENPAMLEQVRRWAESAELMTSVCTGSFILAAAIAGREAGDDTLGIVAAPVEVRRGDCGGLAAVRGRRAGDHSVGGVGRDRHGAVCGGEAVDPAGGAAGATSDGVLPGAAVRGHPSARVASVQETRRMPGKPTAFAALAKRRSAVQNSPSRASVRA